jgi:polyribonucleotide nucleotidyltransferase
MSKNLVKRKYVTAEAEVSGRSFSLETGKLAQYADGSVLARFGETVVLATVVISDEPKEDADFFPLLVDYEEKLYAAGKISGSRFFKREGRPSEEAVLMARMIDRPIRPLFPKGYRNEVQIIVTALSYDPNSEIEVPALIAASSALGVAGAHFDGPIGAVKMGYINNELVANPTTDEMEESDLNITVVGTKERMLMVDGEAREVSTDILLKAFKQAQKELQVTIEVQEDLIKKVKPIERSEPILPDPQIKKQIKSELGSEIKKAIKFEEDERKTEIDKLTDEAIGLLEGEFKKSEIKDAFEQVYYNLIREMILTEGIRPDKRKPDQIRDIQVELLDLPRSHGSGLFQRGMTQVMSIITLASTSKEGLVDTMETDASRRFYHHYNFPPFTVGEIGFMRGPGRREIGHSRLGEKALKPVLPSSEEFPYVIRAVSECLSSNGSTSMGAVCASSVALMAAGVPIKNSVSGVATGLVAKTKGNKIEDYKILADIQGLEDFLGHMDLKIAGTKKGVTAVQLDVKVSGITFEIIEEALEVSEKARTQIREKMDKVISQPADSLSIYAPKIKMVKIDKEKIGDVIGPGGKTINKIIDETDTEIDIDEDGTVAISGQDEEKIAKAIKMVEALGQKPKVGQVYQGEVTRTEDYGAFVEYLPGQEGLVHISELAEGHVKRTTDIVKKGDKIPVMILGVDDKNRVNLSYKSAKSKKTENK